MNIFLIIFVIILSFTNEVYMDGINKTTKESGCSGPNPDQHRHLKWTPKRQSYKVNENIHWQCFEDYKLVGESFSTCQINGKLSSIPECIPPARCLNPDKPHLIISPVKSHYNKDDIVSWKCVPGFRLHGNNRSSCRDKGYFNLIPHCEATHCILNEQHDIIVKPIKKQLYNFDERIEFQCARPGYVIDGSSIAICMRNGSFTKIPRCVEDPIIVSMRNNFLEQKNIIVSGMKKEVSEKKANKVEEDMMKALWANIYMGIFLTILAVVACLFYIFTKYRNKFMNKKNTLDDNTTHFLN